MLLYTSKGVTGSSHFRIRGLLPLRGMLVSDTGPAVANPNSSGKETVWNAPAGFSGLSPGLCPISGCQSPGRMRPVPSQAQRDLSAPVHCIMSICSCTWDGTATRLVMPSCVLRTVNPSSRVLWLISPCPVWPVRLVTDGSAPSQQPGPSTASALLFAQLLLMSCLLAGSRDKQWMGSQTRFLLPSASQTRGLSPKSFCPKERSPACGGI